MHWGADKDLAAPLSIFKIRKQQIKLLYGKSNSKSLSCKLILLFLSASSKFGNKSLFVVVRATICLFNIFFLEGI